MPRSVLSCPSGVEEDRSRATPSTTGGGEARCRFVRAGVGTFMPPSRGSAGSRTSMPAYSSRKSEINMTRVLVRTLSAKRCAERFGSHFSVTVGTFCERSDRERLANVFRKRFCGCFVIGLLPLLERFGQTFPKPCFPKVLRTFGERFRKVLSVQARSA